MCSLINLVSTALFKMYLLKCFFITFSQVFNTKGGVPSTSEKGILLPSHLTALSVTRYSTFHDTKTHHSSLNEIVLTNLNFLISNIHTNFWIFSYWFRFTKVGLQKWSAKECQTRRSTWTGKKCHSNQSVPNVGRYSTIIILCWKQKIKSIT